MSRSRVALVRCSSYDLPCVKDAVSRGLDLLGGLESLFRAGQKVLLKPNLLSPTPPEKCATTHPMVFEAVILALAGKGLEVTYGDSPAIPYATPEYAAQKAGLADVAARHNVSSADFITGRRISNPDGLTAKALFIAEGVLNADAVISLPKLKAHGLTRMTGAVKNQYGCIPGLEKGENHVRYPDVMEFSNMVADVTARVQPRLYVMDAVMAMEGNGPASGSPRALNCILLSTDPVALDATACRIIDLDPRFVPTIAAGVKAGLGVMDPDSIEVAGDPIESFFCRSFQVIRRKPISLAGNPLVRTLKRKMVRRPRIVAGNCTRCATCIRACPVTPKAVDWKNGDKARPPVYDYSRCISCFCCQETCPSRAIVIHTPPLGYLLPAIWLIGGALSIIQRAVFGHRRE